MQRSILSPTQANGHPPFEDLTHLLFNEELVVIKNPEDFLIKLKTLNKVKELILLGCNDFRIIGGVMEYTDSASISNIVEL